jgi:hypothetical protein
VTGAVVVGTAKPYCLVYVDFTFSMNCDSQALSKSTSEAVSVGFDLRSWFPTVDRPADNDMSGFEMGREKSEIDVPFLISRK